MGAVFPDTVLGDMRPNTALYCFARDPAVEMFILVVRAVTEMSEWNSMTGEMFLIDMFSVIEF